MIRQRRRQFWPFLPPRHKRPKLVPIPIPLLRIVTELLRIRTVVRRIHDERVGREVIAPFVPEPYSHLARVMRRRGLLNGRSRRLQARALDRGRRELVVSVVAVTSRHVACAGTAHVCVGRGQRRGRVGMGSGIGVSGRIRRWTAIAVHPGRRLGRAIVGRRTSVPPMRGWIRRWLCRTRTGCIAQGR
jgi:uncharacterized protein with PIN domain